MCFKKHKIYKRINPKLAIVTYTLTFVSLLTCSILASKLETRTCWVNHRVGWETGGMLGIKDQRWAIHSPVGNQSGATFLRGGCWDWRSWASSPVTRAVGRSAPSASLGKASVGTVCAPQWACWLGWLAGRGKGWSPHSAILQPRPGYSSSCNHPGTDRSNHEQFWRGKIPRVQARLVKPSSRISVDTDPLRKRSDWGTKWGKIKASQDYSLC